MLSLFDLEELCKDGKGEAFLGKYGVISAQKECPGCGGSLRKDIFSDRGSQYRRCSGCRKKAYLKSGGLLESSNLTTKQFIYLVYMWAHDCGG